MYLEEVKEDDKRITDAWKEDANGILVFVSPTLPLFMFISMTSYKTGLFSATVGAFIIEFYKKMSPDSGGQTVALLGQISQQLANFPNGTISSTANQPSRPSTSMIWVSAMWLISLVLSVTSALIATLLQQWARRYAETPKVPSEPNDRARVRLFLFSGTESYKMRLLVEIAPTLLHFSVYLFFTGLVIAFHNSTITTNKGVAIAVDVAVGVFGLAYIMLSILPCRDVRCPYRTPMSYILWYPWHTFLSFAARCLHWFLKQLHGCFVKPSQSGDITNPRQRRLVDWLNSCENAFEKHREHLMDGFRKSVIKGATTPQEHGDRKIVTWMFNVLAMDGKNKFQKFAASIPRLKISDLIPLIESGTIPLQEPLLALLRSCAAGTRAAGPDIDEDVRKRSLLVCLEAIRHIAKASSVPDLDFVRANFASLSLMRPLWNDNDTSIRVTSRCICALLAKKVLGEALDQLQLYWLQEVTGEASNHIYRADPVTRDRMNLKSFVNGALPDHVDNLPTEDATSFKETLALLLNKDISTDPDADFDTSTFRNRLSEKVQMLQGDNSPGSHEAVDKLRSMFPFLLETSIPAASAPSTSTPAAPRHGDPLEQV